MQIQLTEPVGDMLMFLAGQEEIDTGCETLYERTKALGPNVPLLLVLQAYSALLAEMQGNILEPAPSGSRKVNIAEMCIAIDDVSFVVDPGFAKQKVYDPKLGMDSLLISSNLTNPGYSASWTSTAYRNQVNAFGYTLKQLICVKCCRCLLLRFSAKTGTG